MSGFFGGGGGAGGGPPDPHAASHQNGGTDEITVAGLSGELADPQPPKVHVHAQSDITALVADLAAIVADLALKEVLSNKNIALGYAGLDAAIKLAGAQQVYGSTVNTACEGNDARLSDQRVPTNGSVSTVKVGDNQITDAKLRDSTGLSVIGRRLNTLGDPVDIVAANDDKDFLVTRVGELMFDRILYSDVLMVGLGFASILGKTGTGTAFADQLTAAQVTAFLDVFTSGLKGLVPASGGGTTNFLRADGTFASPTASVADPNPQSYTPGSFTVDTGKYVILSKTLNLTTTQRATAQGTARVRMT